MNSNTVQRKAYLLALLAVLFWSTIGSAFKITLAFVSYYDLVFWAVLNGTAVLFIYNRFTKTPLQFRKLSKNNWFHSAVMGFLNPFLYYLVLIKAYSLLEAQVASTLNYFWPIVLVLLSIPLLGQKIKPRGLIAIFISFAGIIIISTKGNILSLEFSSSLGVALAIGSAFLWAVYWILNLKDSRGESEKILLNMIFGLFYLIVYFVLL